MRNEAWTPELYIEERVSQYQAWYDKKAVVAKSRYLRMRAFAVVAGGVVPVLINVPFDPQPNGVPLMRILVTFISLLVVVSVSLESVLHYREQWKNYRSTEQLLGHETVAFRTEVSVYRDLKRDEAYKLFVERVEDAIRSENMATLNVMTMATEPSEAGRS